MGMYSFDSPRAAKRYRPLPLQPEQFTSRSPDNGGPSHTTAAILGARAHGLQAMSSHRPRTASSHALAGAVKPESANLTRDDERLPLALYGSLDSNVVGLRHYSGRATSGETLLCIREPTNRHDPYAVRVNNFRGQQIGHLPRTLAGNLAHYMDKLGITVEAVLAGRKDAYSCPVRVMIYGPSDPDTRTALEERLSADKVIERPNVNRTDGSGRDVDQGPTLQELVQGSHASVLHNTADAVQRLVMDEDAMARMPMAEQPSFLRTALLPYQRQGLAWMLEKESPQLPAAGSSTSVQLWRRNRHGERYVNIVTNYATSCPTLVSGGLLADDMGLGKTLTVIALILLSNAESAEVPRGPTLIVAPVTVMSNWEHQLKSHVLPAFTPRSLVYHGNQKISAEQLAAYDIVITSYGKLSMEEKPTAVRGILLSTKWRRVVLDEGHCIRNAKTKTARAACRLDAHSRWVVSGTPIVNNTKDIQSILQFLQLTGGSEFPAVFSKLVARSLSIGSSQADPILQTLMHDLCLRRKKDMKFVNLKLPPKTEYIHRITFRAAEQKKYDALLTEAKGLLEEYRHRPLDGQTSHLQGVLERLLRLRQTCSHWTLCRTRIVNLLKLLEKQDIVDLNDKTRLLLQQVLRLVVESQEDCPVCYETLRSPVITSCKHFFCRECISRVISLQHKCPMCRHTLPDDAPLVEPAPEGQVEPSDGNGEETVEADDGGSSKTDALLDILRATLRDPASKVVVFSQWTSFLDIVQRLVSEAGYSFVQIDGSMSAAARDVAVTALDLDPTTRILLASLGVCGVGLNLVSADTVILADSWWAPAIEDQAVDRVHRLGQTRPTTVWRLVVEGTIEERVLEIQAKKRSLLGKAFSEKDGDRAARSRESRMSDLARLLA